MQQFPPPDTQQGCSHTRGGPGIEACEWVCAWDRRPPPWDSVSLLVHPGGMEAPECVQTCVAEKGWGGRDPLQMWRPRPLPSTRECAPLTLSHSGWAGLGEAPPAGSCSHGAARWPRPRSRRPWAGAAAGRGLRASGVSAVPARGSGADKARCRPGRQRHGSGLWARPPLAGEDAGCRHRGQWKRGKTGWCHGNSQWRPGAGPGGGRRASGLRARSGAAFAGGEAPPSPQGQGPRVPHSISR